MSFVGGEYLLNKFKNNGAVFGVIFLISFFLVLPQIINHSLVLSGDLLFHLNRIYDTYMQFKTGHFNYFQTNYGFQQTGRIVNALYGPGFAYGLGLLLIFLHSWIKFEIITSFLIFFISGYSMYFLSREMKTTKRISVITAVIFMGSFWIVRWSTQQNFMTWGVMLMPLVVLIGLKMIKNNAKDLKILPLSLIMSLLIQIHVLSALMSLGTIIVFFIVGFFKTDKKGQLIGKCLIAGMLTLVLTFNVWGAMLEILTTNNVYAPFAMTNMSSGTMRFSIFRHSVTQIGLVMSLIFFVQIAYLFSREQQLPLANKVVTILGSGFLLLSTNIIPWTRVGYMIPGLQNFLQFPFRFYGLATVLLLAGLGSTISMITESKRRNNSELLLLVGSVLITGQAYIGIQNSNGIWNTDNPIVPNTNMLLKDSPTGDEIRSAFSNSDLGQGLGVVEKPTSDYLPANKVVSKNAYDDYRKNILINQVKVTKKVMSNGNLQLTWQATKENEEIALPIIVYNKSTVVLNGNRVSPQRMQLSVIGSPIIKATKVGTNTLVLSYHARILTTTRLIGVLIIWIFYIASIIIICLLNTKKF